MKHIISLLMITLIMALTACTQHDLKPDGSTPEKMVRLNISAELYNTSTRGERQATVMPVTSGITGYTLTGTRTDAAGTVNETFTTLTGAAVTLLPGTWDFVLTAKDGSGNSMLTGTLPAVNVTSSGATLAFVLKPLSTGNGKIDITISLPGTIEVHSVETLINQEVLSPSLSITANSVHYTAEKPAGNYFITFRFKNAENLLMSSVSEMVRVLPGLTSAASFVLTPDDFNKAPVAPSNVNLEFTYSDSTSDTNARITWTDNSLNEGGFIIELYKNGNFETSLFAESCYATSGYITPMTRGASYSVNVSSSNSFGNSATVFLSGSVIAPWLVSFNMGGGPTVQGIEVVDGGTVGTLPTPAWSGHEFSGWYADNEFSMVYTGSEVITGSKVVYAKWEAVISFNSNGGNGIMAPISVNQGNTVFLPLNGFDMTNYALRGWSDAPDGQIIYFDTSSFIPSSSLTLYAVWVPNLLNNYDFSTMETSSKPLGWTSSTGWQVTGVAGNLPAVLSKTAMFSNVEAAISAVCDIQAVDSYSNIDVHIVAKARDANNNLKFLVEYLDSSNSVLNSKIVPESGFLPTPLSLNYQEYVISLSETDVSAIPTLSKVKVTITGDDGLLGWAGNYGPHIKSVIVSKKGELPWVHYSFESIISDSSGNNRDHTITGSAFSYDTVNFEHLSKSLLLTPGATAYDSGTYALINDSTDLGDEFTIMCKVRPTAPDGSYTQKIQTIFSNQQEAYGYADGFSIMLNSYNNGNNSIHIQYGNSLTSNGFESESNIYSNNTWMHIAVTVDKIAQTVIVYKDGSAIANLAYSPAFKTNGPFRIGTMATSTPYYAFAGNIDDFRIYQKVLTPQEIAGLAQ